MATESKAVTHGDIDFALNSLIGRVIEITLRIWRGVIDCGCDQRMLNRLARNHGLNATACTQRMPKCSLGATEFQFVGMITKDCFDRLSFCLVT